MSVGRYQAYLRLRELDPDITAEEVQAMTMREIEQLLQAYAQETGGVSAPEASGGSSGGCGSRHHCRTW